MSTKMLSKIVKNKKQVSFLILGTQKAGTTSLDSYLRRHPEIQMGNRKELHYFEKDEHFSDSKIDHKLYHQFFPKESNHKIWGECTPSYLYIPSCAPRIYEYNKRIKLIIILRSPIERAYSHWNMQVQRNIESNSFQYCIENENARLGALNYIEKKKYAYVERGFYFNQILNYYQYFPETQILIVKYSDYKNNQELILHRIFAFLGVNASIYTFEKNDSNKSIYSSPMSLTMRNYLINTYRDEIDKLQKLLLWDCSDWLE